MAENDCDRVECNEDALFRESELLQAMVKMLIVRVKEELGIEVPVEDVYSPSMTMESLARKIDNYRLSGVNPSEYADLVAEIEQLTEEEVERLLKEPRP